jgi:hypothetical protein
MANAPTATAKFHARHLVYAHPTPTAVAALNAGTGNVNNPANLPVPAHPTATAARDITATSRCSAQSHASPLATVLSIQTAVLVTSATTPRAYESPSLKLDVSSTEEPAPIAANAAADCPA